MSELAQAQELRDELAAELDAQLRRAAWLRAELRFLSQPPTQRSVPLAAITAFVVLLGGALWIALR
jgi:hypothetical protein